MAARLEKKHPLAIRWMHWINFPVLTVMVWSGVMIYWANQHTALVAGIWWWIFFPVLLVVMTFIGLFLLAVSMNEHIDPRSRLGRTGG